LLYLQSFGNPRKFARIARRMGRTMPVLTVKGGRTPPNVDAEASSTGALLAGSDVTVDTLCRQVGVVRASSLDEVLDVAKIFVGTHLPTGPRVAILTNSRGPALVCADACLDGDLEVSQLVDIYSNAGAREIRRAVKALVDDEEVEALIAICSPSLVTTAVDAATAIAAGVAAAKREIPVLAAFPATAAPPEELHTGPARIASFTFPEAAARALGRAVQYATWRSRPVQPPATVPADADAAAALISRVLADGRGWLHPDETERLCETYGLPLVPGLVTDTPEQAVGAAEALGFPVAVKAMAPEPPYQTDVDAIALGLDSAAGVMAAGARIQARAAAADKEGTRLLVQQMVPQGVRMLVGVVGDPLFGPLLVTGAGGVEAELVRDVAVRLTPVSRDDVRTMIRELRTFPRLDGFRGAPKADVAALEDILIRVGALAEAHPEIAELDCNPVIVTPDGASIVDIRIRVAPAQPLAPLPSTAAP
ncbi:MAG: acetate--CoA ligase family protein, partial [Solirubrobacteraceae bacterium]|nr:acetate--CoA ligase family protein [Solirubrobacteraceae bacterium]